MRRAVVTGANGFIGRRIADELQSTGWGVTIVSRGVPRDRAARGADTYVIAGPWSVASFVKMIGDVRPDVIFHMAGAVDAAVSSAFYETNTLLSARLLDAVAASAEQPFVVLAGSAAEYGVLAADRLPARETEPCRPIGDYAISKYAQTMLAMAHARRGTPVVVARIFNPVGHGMPETLALANFAAQIRAGSTQLHVGNLAVERDFMDVRDAARCIVGLVDKPCAGEVVNICSGRGYHLNELVAALIAASGRPVGLVTDPQRQRPSEMPRFIGDNSRLHRLGLSLPPPDFGVIFPRLLAAVDPAML